MLTLPIKNIWFDMICSGEKKDEYRALNSYYDSRFSRYEGQEIEVMFRNGYHSNSPAVVCVVVPERDQPGLVEWGGIPGEKYWCLHI